MNELLDVSPPILLATVLNVVGYWLKKSPIKDWYIPFILVLLGMVAYPFICDPGLRIGKMVVQGAGIGGLAVFFNQGFRQFMARNADNSGTTFFKKADTNENK